MNGAMRTYSINFGVEGVNIGAFGQYLYDSADIAAYWNYIPLVYCIKTRLDAIELTHKLRPFFPRGNFLIAEINPANINGSLPQSAWDWFYLQHHEKVRPPVFAGIGGALLPRK